jgi:hypothetical protein
VALLGDSVVVMERDELWEEYPGYPRDLEPGEVLDWYEGWCGWCHQYWPLILSSSNDKWRLKSHHASSNPHQFCMGAGTRPLSVQKVSRKRE